MTVFEHMELNTSDPQAAMQFYSQVFGWTYDGFDMGEGLTYWMAKAKGAERGFGGIAQKPAEAPTQWLGYISVKSVRDTADKVRAAGGQVVVDYQEVPGMGAFSICIDPQGAQFAVWESHRPPEPPKASRKKAKKKAKKKAAKKKVAKKAAKKKPAKKKAAKKKVAKKKVAKKKVAKKKVAKKKASKKKRR